MTRQVLFVLVAATLALGGLAGPSVAKPGDEVVIPIPMRTDGPRTLDPARGSSTYDNRACSQLYETLLQVCYYDDSLFEPCLLADLPQALDGGKRYRFKLRTGVRFQDDPCFPGGRGREVVTSDVFYSLKRLADPANGGKSWWLLKDQIVGLGLPPAGEAFDYDAPIEGLVEISDTEFEVALTKPVYRFLWVLTMFQTSVVPHEAVETYGEQFGAHPVGTGPFRLESWTPKQSLVVVRNPTYRECYYPSADKWSAADVKAGLAEAAGQRLPIPDRLEFTMYIEEQPLWLKFREGSESYIELPFSYFEELFNRRTKRPNAEFRRAGYGYRLELQLDMIFRAFNMEDPIVGGYTAKAKDLRRAIAYAIDLDEFNSAFYQGMCVQYDGPIPPTLDGYPEGGRVEGAPRGPDLAKARELLARAGYPDGAGLPALRYYTQADSQSIQFVDMLRRQLDQIGVKLDAQFVDFSQLLEIAAKKQAPMFSFAWITDYPDAENNLAMFYSPNVSPGSNHWNYSRPEYDALYEHAAVLPPGPERTSLYSRMRDMVIEDCPMVGSLARQRFYVWQPWLKNARPTNRSWRWYQYLDVDRSKN